ncbi:hypothetical protein D3C87_1872710 [compost metagenome]
MARLRRCQRGLGGQLFHGDAGLGQGCRCLTCRLRNTRIVIVGEIQANGSRSIAMVSQIGEQLGRNEDSCRGQDLSRNAAGRGRHGPPLDGQ